jgi:hypothetical protein
MSESSRRAHDLLVRVYVLSASKNATSRALEAKEDLVSRGLVMGSLEEVVDAEA